MFVSIRATSLAGPLALLLGLLHFSSCVPDDYCAHCEEGRLNWLSIADDDLIWPEGAWRPDGYTQVITISNGGSRDVSISNLFALVNNPSEFQLPSDFPLTVPANGTYELAVTYSPQDCVADSGMLVLETSQPNHPTLEYEMFLPYGPAPSFQVSRDLIDFGRVYPDETSSQQIVVANTEGCGVPVRIEQLRLFSAENVEMTIVDDGTIPIDTAGPFWLFENDTLRIELAYGNQDTRPLDAALWIVPTLATLPTVEVSLRANSVAPCMLVTPQQAVDLGTATESQPLQTEFVIEEFCGEDLRMLDVSLEDHPELPGRSSFEVTLNASLSRPIALGQPLEMVVSYGISGDPMTGDPEVCDTYCAEREGALLVIQSDDPIGGFLEIPITASWIP